MMKNRRTSSLGVMKEIITLKVRKWFEIGRELLSSLLFPPRCPICDEILTPEEAEKGIHLACENKLYPVEGAVCMHCGRPLGQVKSHRNQLNKEYHMQESFLSETNTMKFYENDDGIPGYLRSESTYEYCAECVRKGYVKNSSITQAKSLYLYKGVIKQSMYRLKYANKREYARFFARQAVEKYSDWLGVPPSEKSAAPCAATQVDVNAKLLGGTPSKTNQMPTSKRKWQKCEAKLGVPPSKTNLAPIRAHFESAPGTTPAPRIDVIVPVPMYHPKQKQRGYNQAEAFARELSRLTVIPVDADCICRVKDTTPQKELNDTERKNNLENAFQKGKSIVQYSHILVVDDIYTTGYTAEAVAKELRKQGGHHIYLLSVCIGGNE